MLPLETPFSDSQQGWLTLQHLRDPFLCLFGSVLLREHPGDDLTWLAREELAIISTPDRLCSLPLASKWWTYLASITSILYSYGELNICLFPINFSTNSNAWRSVLLGHCYMFMAVAHANVFIQSLKSMEVAGSWPLLAGAQDPLWYYLWFLEMLKPLVNLMPVSCPLESSKLCICWTFDMCLNSQFDASGPMRYKHEDNPADFSECNGSTHRLKMCHVFTHLDEPGAFILDGLSLCLLSLLLA